MKTELILMQFCVDLSKDITYQTDIVNIATSVSRHPYCSAKKPPAMDGQKAAAVFSHIGPPLRLLTVRNTRG